MGNRVSCGRGHKHLHDTTQGYMDTPYSKQMSTNIVRFWAEVFLLAQDGTQPSSSTGTPCRRHAPKMTTKWQMVVPKLVPVNIVRVQDNPTMTHVTAYNTKVDKIMDVLLTFPGIDLFRGSDCFVYWCDPQKGLTWGLNFITPEDAQYFVDIVYNNERVYLEYAHEFCSGRTHSVHPRRAHSVVPPSRHNHQPHDCASSTTGSDLLGGLNRRVQFADQPSGSGPIPHPPIGASTCSLHNLQPQSNTNSQVDAAALAIQENKPLQLHLTGQKLHDWGAVLPDNSQTSSAPGSARSEQLPTTGDDSLQSSGKRTPCSDTPGSANTDTRTEHDFASSTSTHISLPVSASGDSFAQWQSDSKDPPDQHSIWTQQLASMALTDSRNPGMASSLDSSALRRMLTPLPIQTTKTSTAAEIVLQQKGQIYTTKIEIPPRPRVQHQTLNSSTTSARYNQCSTTAMNVSSSSISSTDTTPAGQLLATTSRQAHRIKRSSLHLMASANGTLSTPAMVESGSSLSSSQHSDSGTPLASASVRTIQPQTSSNPGPATGPKTRKTGFMLLKRWLARNSDSKFVVCNNEPWHQYWARLKGVNLHLFKVTPGNSELSDAASTATSPTDKQTFTNQKPTLIVDVSRGLVQPMPEYPRRSNVFCISTNSGTAFLLQVTSEAELDGWSSAVHTSAAYDITNTNSKDTSIRALKRELERIEQRIDSVTKMLSIQHMPSVSAVSASQVAGWENELELLHTNQFVMRCYLAALRGVDEPSCKRALGAACAESKRYLSQLGVFTMSAVHAYLLSRIDPVSLGAPHPINSARQCNMQHSRSRGLDSNGEGGQQLQVHLSNGQLCVVSVQPDDTVAMALTKACTKIGLVSRRHFLSFRRVDQKQEPVESGHIVDDDDNAIKTMESLALVDLCDRACYHIHLRTHQHQNEPLGLTVRTQRVQHDLIAYVANVEKGGPADRAGVSRGDELLAVNLRSVRSLPSPLHVEQLLQRSDTLCLVLRSKRHSLSTNLTKMQFTTSTDSLHLSCKPTESTSQPANNHLNSINTNSNNNNNNNNTNNNNNSSNNNNNTNDNPQTEGVTDLDEPWLNSEEGRNKVKYRNLSSRLSAVNRIKQRYSLPPSKRNSQMSNSSGEGGSGECEVSADPSTSDHVALHANNTNGVTVEADVNSLSSSSSSRNTNSHRSSIQSNTSSNSHTKMTTAERLEKILYELVETEKAYIDCLHRLMSQYLVPLKQSALFPESELDRLMATTQAIIRFQTSFFDELQEAAGHDVKEKSEIENVGAHPNVTPAHLRNALVRVGGVLLNASNNFKVYSPFCAVHFRVQKILRQEDKNETLQQFLSSCNTQSQLSCSLESFLIKPIQRVLRYPLFLQQIKSLTTLGSPENLLISEALSKMEKVAEYINEMQRVYEEYGQLFASVQAHFGRELKLKKLSMELSELLMFGECDWLNPTNTPPKPSKSVVKPGKNTPTAVNSIESLCFVFKSFILVAPNQNGPHASQQIKTKKKQSQSAFLNLCRVIPIREVEVNGSDLGSTDRQYLWILIHMNSSMTTERVYHFVNRRQDVKAQFLRAIRKAGLITANRDAAASSTHNHSSPKQSLPTTTIQTPHNPSSGNQTMHLEPISSPDSAGLPHLAMPLLDRCVSEPTKPKHNDTIEVRPASHYSSQSDGGYVSNGDKQPL